MCAQDVDQRMDGQAGAQQSPCVTLEGKILYVMLGKSGGGGPLTLEEQKGALFPGCVAWGSPVARFGEAAFC